MCSTHGWSSSIRIVPDFTHFTITVHACLYVANAWRGTLFTTWVLAAFNIKMEEAAWQIFLLSLWSTSGQGNFSNVGCSSMSCWTLFSNKQVFLLSHLWLTKETSQSYIQYLFACLSRDLLTGCQSLCPNVHLLNAVLLTGLDACPNCDCEFVVNLCYLQSILLVAKLFLTCQQWPWRIDHFTLVDSWGWVWG